MGLTAPNIEAIAASLRNCSLGGRPEPPEEQQLPAAERRRLVQPETDQCSGVTVELNSEVALPYHWEQCLDLRTGEVYYINWKDGTRTTEDPRLRRTSYCSSQEEISEEDDSEAEEDGDGYCDAEDSSSSADDDGEGSDDFYGINTSILSSITHGASPSNTDSQTATACGGEHVLVAAGCRSCFMYFMVSKRVETCPKCTGRLLHLGRNGCF